MSVYDDLFKPAFFWDNEYQQRRDLEALKKAVADASEMQPALARQEVRMERLELLCKTLVELVVAKGLATTDEVALLMQQLDLTDGLEDGRLGSKPVTETPRCTVCEKYLNPARPTCIFCGTPMSTALGARSTIGYRDQVGAPGMAKRQTTMVHCVVCDATLPENQSYFSEAGVVCERCFDPSKS